MLLKMLLNPAIWFRRVSSGSAFDVRFCFTLLVLVFFGPLTAGSLQASTLEVRPDGTGEFPTIQAALDAAAEGDTIALTNGIFTGPGNRALTLGGKGVVLRSIAQNPDSCVIDCEGINRAITIEGQAESSSVIHSVQFRNGWVLSDESCGPDPESEHCFSGGAVLVVDASPVIERCVFDQNEAFCGGAVCLLRSSAIIRDCVFNSFSLKSGASGGGIGAVDSSPSIIDCTFEGIEASVGAGMSLERCDGVIERCAFIGNDGDHGGGLQLSGECSTKIRECSFIGNHCGVFGAAILWDAHGGSGMGSTVRITDCLVEGNYGNYGTIVNMSGGTVQAVRCTLRQNSDVAVITYSSLIDFRDCVFVDNWSDNYAFASLLDLNGSGGSISSSRFVGNYGGPEFSPAPLIRVRDADVEILNVFFGGNRSHTGSVMVFENSTGLLSGCTIRANSAADPSPGGLDLVSSDLSIDRSVIWGNCNPSVDSLEIRVDAMSSLDLACSAVDSSRVGGLGTIVWEGGVFEDPLFCSSADCNATPDPSVSPSIDAASPLTQYASPCGDPIGYGEVACGETSGACCRTETGECIVVSESDCLLGAPVFAFAGFGTTCDPNPCPQPTDFGACCREGGACSLKTRSNCGLVDGVFEGDGSVCEPSPCDLSIGVCCFADQRCEILNGQDCSESGGVFLPGEEGCLPGSCASVSAEPESSDSPIEIRFRNPVASDLLTIELSQPVEGTLEFNLYDMAGRLQWTTDLAGRTGTQDVVLPSRLPSAVYVAIVEGPGWSSRHRVTIVR